MASVTDDAALQFPILIGDIGGTNARFAILVDAVVRADRIPQSCAPPISPRSTTRSAAASSTRRRCRPRSAVLAVAGPVDGDEIPLTNCPWVVKPRGMLATPGISEVVVLNDFEAQALAVVALGEEHMEKIGAGEPEAGASRVVLGPGTGLGVAGLIHACGRWIPVPGEGGHMDIGPRTPRDFEVFPHLETIEGRISGEQILCGRGLVNIYRAVARADGVEPRFTHAGRDHRRRAGQDRRGRRGGAGAVRHLPRPHGRRPGAGVQEPRRRLPDRRHRPEDRAGAEARRISAPPSRTRRRTAR